MIKETMELMQEIYNLNLKGVKNAISKGADVNFLFGELVLKDKKGNEVDLMGGCSEEINPLQLAVAGRSFEDPIETIHNTIEDKTFDEKEFLKKINDDKKTERIEIIKTLIDSGADVNFFAEEACSSVIQQAALFALDEKVIEILLNNGADVSELLIDDSNILHCASVNDNPNIMDVLLKNKEAKKMLNKPDEQGWTPLMSAAACSLNPQIVKVLLEAGANPKKKCFEEFTAFHHARTNGNNAVEQMLISMGVTK